MVLGRFSLVYNKRLYVSFRYTRLVIMCYIQDVLEIVVSVYLNYFAPDTVLKLRV